MVAAVDEVRQCALRLVNASDLLWGARCGYSVFLDRGRRGGAGPSLACFPVGSYLRAQPPRARALGRRRGLTPKVPSARTCPSALCLQLRERYEDLVYDL